MLSDLLVYSFHGQSDDTVYSIAAENADDERAKCCETRIRPNLFWTVKNEHQISLHVDEARLRLLNQLSTCRLGRGWPLDIPIG